MTAINFASNLSQTHRWSADAGSNADHREPAGSVGGNGAATAAQQPRRHGREARRRGVLRPQSAAAGCWVASGLVPGVHHRPDLFLSRQYVTCSCQSLQMTDVARFRTLKHPACNAQRRETLICCSAEAGSHARPVPPVGRLLAAVGRQRYRKRCRLDAAQQPWPAGRRSTLAPDYSSRVTTFEALTSSCSPQCLAHILLTHELARASVWPGNETLLLIEPDLPPSLQVVALGDGSSSQAVFVSLFSVANCIGRLLAG